ncbi:hypothetical protein JCGZ_15835 [Jatropha curcas]|uniref:RRM domain-containing protein n=1 Tax=Jatropha curcas TaxID=180498 RepID=A0A067L2G7_JATCU|nr:29 kDa ribonucleoprotein, chloroplastic [Jatropha curcas]KDP41428.1 hypothetical protein JCGZ_15835 [Jatropha curcas]
MASIRLQCSPSTPYLSLEHHKTATPLFKPFNQSYNSINTNNSSSLSWSLSHSHYRTLPIRINKTSHFVLHFSSTTQDPIVVSSSLTEKDEEQEEFSRTRVLAQNIPWTCTPEDIRTLFEKFGTVMDVELSMHNKTRNRGLAFVTMGSAEEADAAVKNLESYEFEGRTLRINYAKIKKKKETPPPPKPGPTFNLFVANLPFEAKEKELKEFFNAEGTDVVSAEIIYHDNPRRPSGYGFVAFKTKKQADDALSAFTGKIFMGRPIRVARSRQFVRQERKDGSDDTSTDLNSRVEQTDGIDEN